MRLEGSVLVTGGSGFLARALYRRAEREGWPVRFTCLSRDEMKQWELKRKFPQIRCVLGDIRNSIPWLQSLFSGYDMVLHMAAVKFIPEAEHNVIEAIDVNIEGSRNVAMAAIAAGVETVVGISTDKSCAPLNLYGMTKAVMERLFSEANRMGHTNFVTVRYGNVIGSTGSVIPVFQRQLQDHNELRVTDKRMTRFWLSPDEAVEQVIWAANSADKRRGQTFIYPCRAMRITDLAESVWLETGHKGDIPIKFTGIRPGEKLNETLFNEQESPRVSKTAEGYVMLPATTPAPIGESLEAYSSDNPVSWMTVDEMIQAIREAELL